MHWVPLPSNYDQREAVVAAGDDAELLYVRAWAYSGRAESAGFVPDAQVPRLTPTRTKARLDALLRTGLFSRVDGGYLIVDWNADAHDKAVDRRRRDADRKATKRAAARQSDAERPGSVRGQSVQSLRTEVEVDLDEEVAAAAATRPPLPPPVEILRSKLHARKLEVRWDTLTTDQLDEIQALIDVHGDTALVTSAVRGFHEPAPAFASAWLAGWRALPPPGRLAAVPDLCTNPDHHGEQLPCRLCRSERLAGEA